MAERRRSRRPLSIDSRCQRRTYVLYSSCERYHLHQTKRLFVGRLVGKSKGSKTKRLAFDKP
jgi:hypothetical protein